ncbi:P-loop containing nucleoside triphosphate hydrolase protein [Pyronema domesticum]|nr:P-loop containing nucleoside triphosphate hydrolase protein [Pyronema domesticum]
MLKRQISPLLKASLVSTRIPLTARLVSSQPQKQPFYLLLPRRYPNSTHAYSTVTPAQIDLIEKTKSDTGKVKAINILKETQDNLIIEACAGSGKTTLCLAMAASCPDKRFLLLVYNTHLRLETTKRIEDLGLTNITVYNYHSLGYNHYTTECLTDEGLKRIVSNNLQPHTELPYFDILLLDEQQDMTPLYYRFVKKLLSDSGITQDGDRSVRFVLVGDPAQEIYGYNGSSAYFLTNGDYGDVFGKLSKGEWKRVELRLSYRCTPQILKFVNSQILKVSPGKEITSASPEGPKPGYLIDSGVKKSLAMINSWIEKGLQPEDILILAPSLKCRLLPRLVNGISKIRRYIPIHVHVGSGDISGSQNAINQGKMCVFSFHKSKGIERKAVLVFNFDNSYNEYYDKNPTTTERANNAMYVATTRALKRLVLVNAAETATLSFIDRESLHESCDIDGDLESLPQQRGIREKKQHKTTTVTVTDLCDKVHEDAIKKCINELELHENSAAEEDLKVDFITEPLRYSQLRKDQKIQEDYSGDVGVAFTAIYELISKTRVQHSAIKSLVDIMKGAKNIEKSLTHRRIKEWWKDIEQRKHESYTPKDFFILAVIQDACYTMFHHRIMTLSFDNCAKMIEKQSNVFRKMSDNLSRIIGTNPDFHYYFEKEHHTKVHVEGIPDELLVKGRPDIYIESTKHQNGTKEIIVYEIKIGSQFEPEHFLQLAIYCAMVKEAMEKAGNPDINITGILVNPRTQQSIKVTPKPTSSYLSILKRLVSEKYGDQQDRPSIMGRTKFLDKASTGFPVSSPILPEWVNRNPMHEAKLKARKYQGRVIAAKA